MLDACYIPAVRDDRDTMSNYGGFSLNHDERTSTGYGGGSRGHSDVQMCGAK